MRSLGKLGLALSLVGSAAMAHAAPDSRPPLPADDLNAAQMERTTRIDTAPPTRGGWSRNGWSDDAGATRGEAARHADPRAYDPRDDGPRADAASARPPRDWQRDAGPRRERRDDTWRRETWDGGRGNAFAYRRGGRLPDVFGRSLYAVRDWEGYGLIPPGPGRRWVRYYDDAVLLNGRGYILDAEPGIGWDDRGPEWDDADWRDGGPRIDHRGPGPRPQVHYGPGGATTIVITTAPSVATTTTTTTETSYVTRKRVWRPARVVQTRPAHIVQTKARRTTQTKPGR